MCEFTTCKVKLHEVYDVANLIIKVNSNYDWWMIAKNSNRLNEALDYSIDYIIIITISTFTVSQLIFVCAKLHQASCIWIVFLFTNFFGIKLSFVLIQMFQFFKALFAIHSIHNFIHLLECTIWELISFAIHVHVHMSMSTLLLYAFNSCRTTF